MSAMGVPSREPSRPYAPRGRAALSAEVHLRGRSTTIVHVRGALPYTPDERILKAALLAAREDKSSLFGWSIDRTLDVIAVALHTD